MTIRSEVSPVLAVRHVSKHFQSVVALDDVSLEVHAGEVLALLGDNGAGKSTLIKILSGVDRPTAGTLEIDGEEISLRNPHQARGLGISTVFQDLAVCELLSISRNMVLGNEPTRQFGPFRFFDPRAAEQIARDALQQLGVEIHRDMGAPAATLSGGQRQAIAIARAIYYGSKCLILDEPTAALAVRQTQQVLDQVRTARASGQAVILIGHNLEQAVDVADRAVVLSRGRVAATFETASADLDDIREIVARG